MNNLYMLAIFVYLNGQMRRKWSESLARMGKKFRLKIPQIEWKIHQVWKLFVDKQSTIDLCIVGISVSVFFFMPFFWWISLISTCFCCVLSTLFWCVLVCTRQIVCQRLMEKSFLCVFHHQSRNVIGWAVIERQSEMSTHKYISVGRERKSHSKIATEWSSKIESHY